MNAGDGLIDLFGREHKLISIWPFWWKFYRTHPTKNSRIKIILTFLFLLEKIWLKLDNVSIILTSEF